MLHILANKACKYFLHPRSNAVSVTNVTEHVHYSYM